MSGRRCEHCGSMNRSAARHCAACGKELSNLVEAPADPNNPFGLPDSSKGYFGRFVSPREIPDQVRGQFADGLLKLLGPPLLVVIALIAAVVFFIENAR